MLSSITKFLKKIWDKWNIRVVILFSLFLQFFLIVSAPSRKRTRSFLVSSVWLAYLLADWSAGYCIGLISKNQEQNSTHSPNDNLMAFWGPFLLLHLGGPDTISAFAMEDNELWLRHLLGLFFQLAMAGYVFLLTISHNTLFIPTILMFVAGLIKYAERTHALYVAAVNNFRKSLLPRPDAGPNYAKLMEEHYSRKEAGLPAKIIMIPELRQRSDNTEQNNKDDIEKSEAEIVEEHSSTQNATKSKAEENKKALELVQTAYIFFDKFQGLIVDMIYSFKDRLDSQEKLQKKTAEEALGLIEIELNFMYEVFYTKASVIRQYWLWCCGKPVSLILIMVTLVLFNKEERHGDFDMLDVRVTYALLYGALVLDVMALVMCFFTDYIATLSEEDRKDSYSASSFQKSQVRFFKYFNESFLAWLLRLREPTWSTIKEGTYGGCEKLSTNVFFRRWRGSISGHNLLKYCLDESIPRAPRYLHQNKIVNSIQRVCFIIVVFVQDLFYLRDRRSRFKDFLDQMRYESESPFLKEFWNYVFAQLKEKSCGAQDVENIQNICSARGERVIQKMLETLKPNVDANKVEEQLERLKPFVDPNEVAFDETLLLWHIATALCYFRVEGDKREDATVEGDERENATVEGDEREDATVEGDQRETGGEEKQDKKDERMEISMILSDYMLYLLIMQPNMMSAIAGIGQIRFQDTCEEAKKFLRKRITAEGDRKAMLNKACTSLMKVPTEQKPIDVKGDRSKSLLFDACRLARELDDLEDEDKKWEIISCVWVELLSYAACHCRPTGHVQLLSKGGEFISFVWLLMVHLGLSTRFQIKEGDARAKLIVGKLLS